MRYLFLILIFPVIFLNKLNSQNFSRQDILRGSITKERAWWDLQHYDLNVKISPSNRTVTGSNTIHYKVVKKFQTMQIDLQIPMQISKVTQNNKNLDFKRDGNVFYIQLKDDQKIGDNNELTIHFTGKPTEAINPPWDGGLTWQKDENKNHFIATSNQGIGASVWWPCKDHPADEPDNGADIKVTTPDDLTDVSNGRLIDEIDHNNGTKTYHWKVVNPINSYAINLNIANYVHFSEVYPGEKGDLDCNYYVLPDNLEKAKTQFKQVPKMLEAFEHWFGPYPFYEDSYKLVEVPYLGMEHQSSVTYGNRYENGYLGNDLSGTGWGLKFDFIIIHESGHEWFANSITNRDVADMWIHEGFTTYSEVLYLDYHFGTEAGNEYIIGYRKKVANDRPVIGKYNVNNHGSTDMYVKGAAMIHTYRQIINDEEKFREILREINRKYYHKTVNSEEVESFLDQYTKTNLKGFFNQYLRTIDIPRIDYKFKKKKIKYRFRNTVKGFKIPVKVFLNDEEKWVKPKKRWKKIKIKKNSNPNFYIDPNFYIENNQLN
ncbi:MAG: M1 family metallopeptidase [Bacteroidota bacterium]